VSIVTERANTIVWVLVLAYLVSIAATCPPVVRARIAHDGSHATAHAADHNGGCSSAGTMTFLAAACPCGCAERNAAFGARSGAGLALLLATAPLAPPSGAGVIFAEPSHAPLPPARAIDHVPLPA
jgi:hypothetical protein